MTNLELVSRISNTVKSLTKDGRISPRYILRTAQEKAKYLLVQNLTDRSLYREANIYTEVPCIELEKEDIVSCPIVEFRRCKSIMKSKKKLPELLNSKYGVAIYSVTSVDGEFQFTQTTPNQYRLDSKRNAIGKKPQYFYVKDGYLYLLESEVLSVTVSVITLDLYDADQCSECRQENCKSAWDYEFVCSDKLLEVVIQETIKELLTNKQIQENVNPNLNKLD
jgi:hypothetical protein